MLRGKGGFRCGSPNFLGDEAIGGRVRYVSDRGIRLSLGGDANCSEQIQLPFRRNPCQNQQSTPALIAGALLENVIEKAVCNQRPRYRTSRSLGPDVVEIVAKESTRFNKPVF